MSAILDLCHIVHGNENQVVSKISTHLMDVIETCIFNKMMLVNSKDIYLIVNIRKEIILTCESMITNSYKLIIFFTICEHVNLLK